jgi:hypothetical protein
MPKLPGTQVQFITKSRSIELLPGIIICAFGRWSSPCIALTVNIQTTESPLPHPGRNHQYFNLLFIQRSYAQSPMYTTDMKLLTRILLTAPLILLTYAFCTMHNPDVDCSGLVNTITNTSFYILLIIAIAIALIGIFRKRQSNKFRAEPISLSLVVSSLFTLIFYAKLQGHISGEKWIAAENRNIKHASSSQELLLKKTATTPFVYMKLTSVVVFPAATQKREILFFLKRKV